MKKRVLAMILALVMCLALLPTAALAAEAQKTAGANLAGAERKIYEAMSKHIAEVASGRDNSTQITISFTDGELSWTAQELGLSKIDNQNVVDPVNNKISKSLDKIYTCLELDFPFEMFWANNYWSWEWYWEYTDSKIWISEMNYSIDVTPAYRGDSLITTNPYKIAQAGKALEAARSIVRANEGKTDYEKLTAYRDEICRLTSYNYEDYERSLNDEDRFGRDHTYGDPWQMVYVFDGDPSTNVVCEGYSKAFKLLCDLSDFNGDVTCYLVEGRMDSEDHMWNVVKMGDGKFYLVDVTNSDSGETGGRGGLFLAGASGSGKEYVVSNDGGTTTYIYRDDQADLFLNGFLPVSSTAYSPDNDPSGAAPVTPDKPTLPEVIDIPATGTAVASTQSVLLDGKKVEFQMYAIIDSKGGENNFIKLRDLAQLLNSTKAHFNAGWDEASDRVTITSNTAYVPNGSEGSVPFSGNRAYRKDTAPVRFDGKDVPMTAFKLTDDQGGDYTYYRLRDLGQLLNFNVGWSEAKGVFVETDKPYTDAD